jgi:hypothetical protein
LHALHGSEQWPQVIPSGAHAMPSALDGSVGQLLAASTAEPSSHAQSPSEPVEESEHVDGSVPESRFPPCDSAHPIDTLNIKAKK